MTVKYLQNMQRNQINMNSTQISTAILHKFKAGFSDCTNEVNRYIDQIDGVDVSVKQRLMGHLKNCVTSIQQGSTSSTFKAENPVTLTPTRPFPNSFDEGKMASFIPSV